MIKLYNTLTRKMETFIPINQKEVTMYVCGPTVYSHIHVGNARPVIFFDVVRNYFEFLNYKVNYVSNITDIDDKIIDEAKKLGISELELTNTYTNKFIEASLKVGSNLPNLMPKATDYINSMITYIQDLIDKDYAYRTKSGVYFNTSKLDDYGILSNQKMNELEKSVRIENKDDKKDFKDFTLWKITNEGLSFDSPFGKGRPGWHTECAVMNNDIFGNKIDIHGGGSDLIFPHHENEIAQSKAHSNHHLANYWLHVGRLDFDSEKMSKSLGNTVLVKDILNPLAFRLLVLAHNYRSPINYSNLLMEEYENVYDRILRTLKRTLLKVNDIYDENLVDNNIIETFKKYMNDDFNTAKVISLILENVKNLNTETNKTKIVEIYNANKIILHILNFNTNISISSDIISAYNNWNKARDEKNYELADELRQKLLKEGWI